MDATNSHLGELQDNLLLNYEAQNPNIVHLYPQAIANPAGKFINLYKFYLLTYLLVFYLYKLHLYFQLL